VRRRVKKTQIKKKKKKKKKGGRTKVIPPPFATEIIELLVLRPASFPPCRLG
jgi:hypothetical protein